MMPGNLHLTTRYRPSPPAQEAGDGLYPVQG